MKLGIVMVEDRPSPYADQIKKVGTSTSSFFVASNPNLMLILVLLRFFFFPRQDVAKTLTALCDDRIKVIKS